MDMNFFEEVTNLPDRLNPTDTSLLLEISLKYRVRYIGSPSTNGDEATVRANKPIPVNCSLFYFEVTIQERGDAGDMSIGLVKKTSSLCKLPGMESGTIGYLDNGRSVKGQSPEPYAQPYKVNDVVGCGINFPKQAVFFTKNGQQFGDISFAARNADLYPAVGMCTRGRELEVNFGNKPFTFNLEHYKAELCAVMRDEVLQTPLPTGSPARVNEIILEYLQYMGYLDTAKSLSLALQTPLSSREDDILKRQVVRRYILCGDIDSAIKSIEEGFPGILERNSDLQFKLRCQEFVEFISAAQAQGDLSDDVLKNVLSIGQELYRMSQQPGTCSPENDHLFQNAAALLAITDKDHDLYHKLTKPSCRANLARIVNAQLLTEQSQEPNPMLEQIFEAIKNLQSQMSRLQRGMTVNIESLLDL